MMVNTCRVPGCHAPRNPSQLMCLTHWRQVPAELRHEVWRTYRAYKRNVTNATWLAASLARDEAIEAVCPTLDDTYTQGEFSFGDTHE